MFLHLYTYYVVRKLQNNELKYLAGPFPFSNDADFVVRHNYRGESDVRVFEQTMKGRLLDN